ncbi:thrombospondin type-1 domain-containing protein 7B-like [Oratosquilla oratoria]|uniref:thrombospondin type-1 domain-containing protein 7B-like n=1 Tax=Oratosquilla oratoria TaxID=337810 RepID=UPI003F763BDC
MEETTSFLENERLSSTELMGLISIRLDSTYFRFKDHIYHQRKGTPMGSRISVVVAEMVMQQFEAELLRTAPLSLKSWVRYKICSTADAVSAEKRYLRDVFRTNGYPGWTIWKWTRTRRTETQSPHTGHRVTIPYIKDASEVTARVLRDKNIQVAHKPRNAQHHLTRVKDTKAPIEQAGVVYRIGCLDCDWGRCWSVSGCGQGREERTVWCGDLTGSPVPVNLCTQLHKPAHSRSCYNACPDGRWAIGNWGECQIEDGTGVNHQGRCRGIRRRNITCVTSHGEAVSDALCVPLKPAVEDSCARPCPQHCVVGPWGEWAPCRSCVSDQRRSRAVLVGPLHGGRPCPALSEARPCNLPCPSSGGLLATISEDVSQEAKLRVGMWGPCQDPEDEENLEDYDVETTETLQENEEMPLGEEEALEGDEENEEDDEGEQVTRLEIENRLLQKRLALRRSREPRIGFQVRPLECVHPNASRLPVSTCGSNDRVAPGVRTCVLSVDCVVTDWSDWVTSRQGCVAPNGQVVHEVRERRRSALALQQGNGQPCPHLVEQHTLPDLTLQPCDTRYSWLASSWGPCVSWSGEGQTINDYYKDDQERAAEKGDDEGEGDAKVLCGGGVQTRRLTCIRAKNQVPVEDDLCAHVQPPPSVQRCEVGCERDCVVGPWSAWGPCQPEDCTSPPPPGTHGFRRRKREMVVSPSRNGMECPALEEQSECSEAQCHNWVLDVWSDCQLINPKHSCGEGMRTRNATCRDAAGAIAPTTECDEELGGTSVKQECHVPCSFDCVVAPWSPWSPCSRSCASQLHVGYTHRNTSVIAPPGPGGRDCPAPDELTEVETCRVEPCGGAVWSPGPWGTCRMGGSAPCGPGQQNRAIRCTDKMNNTLAERMCEGLSRPAQERACDVPCGNECTVTSWSVWSPCLAPDPCPMEGVLVSSVQRRWRRVLVPESKGSLSCPPLQEERLCAKAPVSCTAYSWRTSSWSHCRLHARVSCGVGYRTRSVECVDGQGNVVAPTQCLLGDAVVPESIEKCHMDCFIPCTTSAWTPWTPCPQHPPCGSPSFRTRLLLDGTSDNVLCRNVSLRETTACPCHTYFSTPVRPWSECLVGEGEDAKSVEGHRSMGVSVVWNGRRAVGVCGVGRRYRPVVCSRNDGLPAHPVYCGHKGEESEPCMVPCPSDCHTSHWGEWSRCNASCGAGVQTRKREILEPSMWGGRPCPEVEQTRACWGACDALWMPSGWGECRLGSPGETDCGTGIQSRTVRCMRTTMSGLLEIAEDSACDALLRPAASQNCRVSCPGDCVVDQWSDWSTCPEGCPEAARRNRTREILRRPVGNINVSCPPLTEEERCVVGESCWRFLWRVANWTSCIPLGQSSCGEGVRNRPVKCVRSDGTHVNDRMCPRETRPTPGETWCYVDCPIDCEVTPWTPWDDSKCSCGENPGEMTRQRYISVNPSERGRPCPASLLQTRPCPALPCYTWERGPWSGCRLEGGSCGHGVVERNVSCVGPGGQVAHDKLCLALVHVGGHTWPYLARALDLNTQDGCYVPCKGDCELSEWSKWSHCHRDCTHGHQGGSQTRSRAVLNEGQEDQPENEEALDLVLKEGVRECPGPLWETRPCLAGPCLNFTWAVMDGRAVCMRSDGLVVTGGCESTPKPCVPGCRVHGSVCSVVGVCVCRPGLTPQYSETQRFRLTSCVPSTNYSRPVPQPLADVKYLPEDINVWMFAMVGIGSAFVVFVVISVYLMCQSSSEQSPIPLTVRRQNTLRHPPAKP